MNRLFIIGAGGHCRVAIDVAIAIGYTRIQIIDVRYNGQDEKILGCQVVGDLSSLQSIDKSDIDLFVAIGDNTERQSTFHQLLVEGFNMINLIHPTAIISQFIQLQKGIFIGGGAIINTAVNLDSGCIINTGAIIDHECNVGSFSHIAPGVCIAGRVDIGELTFVGIGSSVIDKINIGSGVTIGAGSIIIRDVADNSRVVGVTKIIES